MRRRRPDDQESSVGLPSTMSPTALTRHTPEKRLSVSPEVILGVFYLRAMLARRFHRSAP